MSWFDWSTKLLLFLSGALFTAALFLSLGRGDEMLLSFSPAGIPPPLTSPFIQNPKAYGVTEESPFSLRKGELAVTLPNLKGELTFAGVNERPDAKTEEVHLRLKGEHRAISEGDSAFIALREGSYEWSLGNESTGLWVVPRGFEGGRLRIEVGMRRSDGELVVGPEENRVVTLAKKEGGKGSWSIAEHRVDNSLLSRMRAHWFGEDLFLGEHGGSEFAVAGGKQRVDFGEGAESYSCFVGLGDSLVWKEGRWHPLEGRGERLPLLHLKRVDEKLMVFDLWDGGGQNRTSLSLMRGRDAWLPSKLRGNVRFVGAKTRTQFVLEMDEERIVVSPHDWLFLGEEGWKKLKTLGEIDNYVTRTTIGELLVIDELRKVDGKQILEGHLFNKSRTGRKEVELTLAHGGEL